MKKRTEKGKKRWRTEICVLVACSMFIMTASVCLANYNFDGFPVETRTSGIVNGGVYIGYEPWASSTTLTGYFDVPPGTVKWARLYTGIWGGTEDNEGWVNVSFNGVYNENGFGPIHLQGKNDTNPNVWCSSHGKYWLYYNVTNLTNSGSTNTATTSKINSTVGSFDGRVYGIVLVVVYEDGSNKVQYWINDGSDSLNYITPRNEGTTYFDGSVDTANISGARLTMVHLTGYEPSCSNCLWFNQQSLDTSMVDSNTFELNSWDVTDYIAPLGNNASYSRGSDTFVNPSSAILTLERICGDVDGLPGVTTNDGRQVFMYLLYGPESYPIHDLWAADCDGLWDGITTNDGRQIFMNLLYGSEQYPLVCCT
jgi:hypothetical protein